MSAEGVLVGWKAIAAWLEAEGGPASERMARYLAAQGMPVYQASAGGRVMAVPQELKLWWKGRLRLVGAKHVSTWCQRLPRGRKMAEKQSQKAA